MVENFRLKKAVKAVTAAGLIGTGCVAGSAFADITFYTADSTNTSKEMMYLTQSYLGNSILSSPGSLATGSNSFAYSAVVFTPTEDGTYSFGQTYSPVDTIMILYTGIFDPANPGIGALVGNDDTPQATHQSALGTATPIYCASSSWCPQITFNVQAGYSYTLLVSVYSPSYNTTFDLPFQFYSTGSVVFGTHTGRSPIDLVQPFYLGSELGVTVDPRFVGGTLKLDIPNGVYTDDFTLANMSTNTIDANGNHSTFDGVFSDAVAGTPGVITIVDNGGGGSVTFNAANTYTGSTTLKSGILSVAQDVNLGDPSAELILDGGTLLTTASFGSVRPVTLASTGTLNVLNGTVLDLAGVVAGTGSVTKAGGGTLVLNNDNTYTGLTDIVGGTLIVGDASNPTAKLSGGGVVTVHGGGTLGGYGEITGDVVNDGIFAPGNASSYLSGGAIGNMTVGGSVTNSGLIQVGGNGVGNTLTVNGDYIGNNGSIAFNTTLGGDSSLTDKMIVHGDTAGTTSLYITNVGGTGQLTAGDGIEVIQVDGASNGTFRLGSCLVAGAYEYDIYQGGSSAGNPNWYLRSLGKEIVRPEAGVYLSNLAAASTMFEHSLHDRLGEPQFSDVYKGNGNTPSVWVRVAGNHSENQAANGQIDMSTDTGLVQFGGDLARWSNNGDDRMHFGLMGAYGHSDISADPKVKRTASGLSRSAKGKVDGYSVGAYATWYGNSAKPTGPYVDTWAQYNWFNNKVQGNGLKEEKYDSTGWTVSVEGGYAFVAGENNTRQLIIEPQAQVAYNSYSADDHKESNGTWVRGGDADGVSARVGARMYTRSKTSDNAVQPFIEANWRYNDAAKNSMTFDGETVSDGTPENRFELKAGLQGEVAKGWQVWGHVGGQWGENKYNRYEGMVGVKHTF